MALLNIIKINKHLKTIIQSERERADNYQQQLKTVAKTIYQWQKINYHRQLEQKRKELEAKVEQPTRPPPIKK